MPRGRSPRAHGHVDRTGLHAGEPVPQCRQPRKAEAALVGGMRKGLKCDARDGQVLPTKNAALSKCPSMICNARQPPTRSDSYCARRSLPDRGISR